ncbi:MAG: polysaccharide deacetylase family protein [Lentisphaeraceae bacterium]|nr:polysaccharide deacetylase family protein [Lentisphaeraceae bacterium]
MKSFLLLCLISFSLTFNSFAAEKPPVVILKLDDLKGKQGKNFHYPRWKRIADFLAERKIKSSFGIIGKDLEGDKPEFFAWCKQVHESGIIEIWNHGYTHGKVDYKGKKVGVFSAGYDLQLDYFQRTQKLAKEKLGITFNTFGSPFNALSQDTAKVLASDPEMKVWLYGNGSYAKKGGFTGLVLGRNINLENPVHNPNYEKFVARYEKGNLGKVITIQGHPNGWDDKKWAAFVKIIDFLQEKGCEFTTPYEYFKNKKK